MKQYRKKSGANNIFFCLRCEMSVYSVGAFRSVWRAVFERVVCKFSHLSLVWVCSVVREFNYLIVCFFSLSVCSFVCLVKLKFASLCWFIFRFFPLNQQLMNSFVKFNSSLVFLFLLHAQTHTHTLEVKRRGEIANSEVFSATTMQ